MIVAGWALVEDTGGGSSMERHVVKYPTQQIEPQSQ
jgi:hypothetical protein